MKTNAHPLSLVEHEIVSIFEALGFAVALGPELEVEHYNFDALNVSKDHPARDMQDTFWIDGKNENDAMKKRVLRTHTSPVQVRYMESQLKAGILPPYAIIAPGKVFRNEATDNTHEAQFHQIEGLFVGRDISVAHLKGVLLEFFKKFIGEQAQIRLRPSYFPFVEPGFEVDVWTGTKWMEVLGAGMIHPNVLISSGIDPKEYSGFAFGMGLDRLTMIRYQIPDVRLLYQGDARLNQW
jgi:phenylalanyl-tRNA synthetase alpha chain